MELRQLKYFKEACELQNFSEAARVLHISQSTLSQQIKLGVVAETKSSSYGIGSAPVAAI